MAAFAGEFDQRHPQQAGEFAWVGGVCRVMPIPHSGLAAADGPNFVPKKSPAFQTGRLSAWAVR